MEAPRIHIGIPHLGGLPGYFVRSLVALKKGGDTNYFLTMVPDHPVDLARNLLVEAFLDNSDATHLVMLDADMTFPRNALERLLASGKDIISGTYFARTETPTPHAYRFVRRAVDGAYWYRSLAVEFTSWLQAHPEHVDFGNEAIIGGPALHECDAVGAGILVMTREVLEAVYAEHSADSHPWFKCHPGSRGGEDFEFCRRAKALGYQIWTDFSVQCDHFAPGNFTGREEFIEAFRIGTDEAYDFQQPIEVEVGPDGKRRLKVPGPVASEPDPGFKERLKQRVGLR